jgi:hypothetical protein
MTAEPPTPRVLLRSEDSDGEISVIITAGPGQLVFAPRGVPHTYAIREARRRDAGELVARVFFRREPRL